MLCRPNREDQLIHLSEMAYWELHEILVTARTAVAAQTETPLNKQLDYPFQVFVRNLHI